MKTTDPLLEVRHLKMYFKNGREFSRTVDDLSFTLHQGETLGFVGESGCGKSTLMKSLIRVLPDNCVYRGGEVLLDGIDIIKLPEREMRNIRGRRLSMITQNAMNSLDPAYRVGKQLVETIQTHRPRVKKKEAWETATRCFEFVGLSKNKLNDFPHLLSGGMRQRAMIAMAIVLDPDIVIADEPTTALDVIIQAQVLGHLKKLRTRQHASLIIVTHDISVVAQTCDTMAVMYGGKIVEYGGVRDVLRRPLHPYTMGLNNSFPTLFGKKQGLISIPGTPPDLTRPNPGCRFSERCPFEIELCAQQDPVIQPFNTHSAACHRADEANTLREKAKTESLWRKKGG